MPILEVQSLTRQFGGLTAVNDLSFSVEPGEIRGLIGPNGAGKTTTFNVISGFHAPSSGRIVYRGKDIGGMKTSAIAQMGMIRTFQATTLFQEFSVLDNVLMGCHLHAHQGFLRTLLGLDTASKVATMEKALEILEFFDLQALQGDLAMNLPHGLQRTLGMAVALAADPKVLLLDEPFTGMNPKETRSMMRLVGKVHERDVTILLVEHDMRAVMGLCHKITVLNFGCLLAEGSPDEIKCNTDVIEAYLGAAGDAA